MNITNRLASLWGRGEDAPQQGGDEHRDLPQDQQQDDRVVQVDDFDFVLVEAEDAQPAAAAPAPEPVQAARLGEVARDALKEQEVFHHLNTTGLIGKTLVTVLRPVRALHTWVVQPAAGFLVDEVLPAACKAVADIGCEVLASQINLPAQVVKDVTGYGPDDEITADTIREFFRPHCVRVHDAVMETPIPRPSPQTLATLHDTVRNVDLQAAAITGGAAAAACAVSYLSGGSLTPFEVTTFGGGAAITLGTAGSTLVCDTYRRMQQPNAIRFAVETDRAFLDSYRSTEVQRLFSQVLPETVVAPLKLVLTIEGSTNARLKQLVLGTIGSHVYRALGRTLENISDERIALLNALHGFSLRLGYDLMMDKMPGRDKVAKEILKYGVANAMGGGLANGLSSVMPYLPVVKHLPLDTIKSVSDACTSPLTAIPVAGEWVPVKLAAKVSSAAMTTGLDLAVKQGPRAAVIAADVYQLQSRGDQMLQKAQSIHSAASRVGSIAAFLREGKINPPSADGDVLLHGLGHMLFSSLLTFSLDTLGSATHDPRLLPALLTAIRGGRGAAPAAAEAVDEDDGVEVQDRPSPLTLEGSEEVRQAFDAMISAFYKEFLHQMVTGVDADLRAELSETLDVLAAQQEIARAIFQGQGMWLSKLTLGSVSAENCAFFLNIPTLPLNWAIRRLIGDREVSADVLAVAEGLRIQAEQDPLFPLRKIHDSKITQGVDLLGPTLQQLGEYTGAIPLPPIEAEEDADAADAGKGEDDGHQADAPEE